MEPVGKPAQAQAGPFTKLLLKIAGVDEATLRQCPQHDWDNVRAVAEIQLFVFCYQAALFAIIGQRLFANPGQVRADLTAGALFLAAFISLLDSYMFMRSGWHQAGIAELKRGGLDISGGPWRAIKTAILLTVRIALSVGLAQLTAIFVSLLIFASDVETKVENTQAQHNAGLIATATTQTDEAIRRAAAAVDTQAVRVTAAAAQLNTVRQNQIDPAAGAPALRQAQDELNQLLARQTQADDDVRAAELVASNELGGVKSALTSGLQGDGPKHQAAVEQLTNARNRAQAVATAVSTARERIERLTQQLAADGATTRERADEQLPDYEATLATEQAELDRLKSALGELQRNREATIRHAVEAAPGYVGRDDGLLAQIKILGAIAQDDTKTIATILLIDFVSFSFELGAVLAKITSYIPTTYAALLARNAYMNVVAIVDDTARKLDRDHPTDEPPDEPPDDDDTVVPFTRPANDNPSPPFPARSSMSFMGGDDPPQPPRRPRGRPRKEPPA